MPATVTCYGEMIKTIMLNWDDYSKVTENKYINTITDTWWTAAREWQTSSREPISRQLWWCTATTTWESFGNL